MKWTVKTTFHTPWNLFLFGWAYQSGAYYKTSFTNLDDSVQVKYKSLVIALGPLSIHIDGVLSTAISLNDPPPKTKLSVIPGGQK